MLFETIIINVLTIHNVFLKGISWGWHEQVAITHELSTMNHSYSLVSIMSRSYSRVIDNESQLLMGYR